MTQEEHIKLARVKWSPNHAIYERRLRNKILLMVWLMEQAAFNSRVESRILLRDFLRKEKRTKTYDRTNCERDSR